MIEEVVLKQLANQNFTISEIYKTQIWDNNLLAISKLKHNNISNILTDKDFIRFVKNTKDFFIGSRTSITIYDKLGNAIIKNTDEVTKNTDEITNLQVKVTKNMSLYNLVLVTTDKYFLNDYISDQPLNIAYHGKIQHNLISKSMLMSDDASINAASVYIDSYIPIIDTKNGRFNIDGVIKISTEITTQWNNITYLAQRIFFAFLLVFIIFFIIIMYNTHHAQKFINKQFETNRALQEAKTLAENESLAKTDFLANVSHELRTPLNAIIGFSEIIIAETYGKIQNQNYRDYIHDINNSGNHLLGVINDILDFSKVSADKLQIDNVELDLNKLASSSMRFVKPRADDAGVHLVEKLPKEHIIILADPKRLKQALLNLLSNAVKFTPPSGSVTLSLKKDVINKTVYISVVDTGIGMNDQDIPTALSSFGQVDNKLSRKYEGTGLGLPLTKKLIELMNGKFDLQSKERKGTIVTIIFSYSEIIDL